MSVHPIPALSFEALQSVYDKDYTNSQRDNECAEGRDLLQRATERQMDMVEAMISKGSALNVGAMTSASKVLQDRGWHLHVVEVSEYAAETARTNWGMNVVVSKLEDVEFPPGHFDFIKLGHVIEHLADPRAVLAKLNHFLRKDGVILIDTNNAESLRTRIEMVVRRALGEQATAWIVSRLTGKNLHRRYGQLVPPEHLYVFTERSLVQLLEETGFSVCSVFKPARGHPIWFPVLRRNRLSLIERIFLRIDALGGRLGLGEVLVIFARKETHL